ncbi:hypothetical protein DPX16_4145 [Anabarilius grahami]|uniref:Secreted protein n=1 Tax=Anabarilius grahami TaxID=495550 RepID=A0A3N0XZL8_ANAGA|nr:hypothetical protein DPX16_4145 [Anabarilius grahami]
MAMFAQSSSLFCVLSVQTVLLFSVSSPGTATLLFPQHYTDVKHLIFALECTVHQLLSEVRVLGPCQLCARMGQRLDLSAVCPHMPVPSGLSRLTCCMKS